MSPVVAKHFLFVVKVIVCLKDDVLYTTKNNDDVVFHKTSNIPTMTRLLLPHISLIIFKFLVYYTFLIKL